MNYSDYNREESESIGSDSENRIPSEDENLGPELIEEIEQAFKKIDKDGNNNKELQELISNIFPHFPLLPAAGFQVTNKEIENIIDNVDTNGSGAIQIDEFKKVMKNKMQEIDFDEEIIEAFRIFDTEGGCKITLAKIKEILKKSDPKIPDDEINIIIREIDKHNDGTFHYEEYISDNSYSSKKSKEKL
ncbi:unnamed protein product [Moneuplotes crassus]|uniref:EF-hand domain-containing protein n=1 Tax=Euplotes crassus TaxID=5936 RepID=A0AAD1XXC2_EUPCR|nr:unnamed protein product [Moneuplotes crassus]